MLHLFAFTMVIFLNLLHDLTISTLTLIPTSLLTEGD
jgi:hypothetical protein